MPKILIFAVLHNVICKYEVNEGEVFMRIVEFKKEGKEKSVKIYKANVMRCNVTACPCGCQAGLCGV